ncbi:MULTISPECIES: GNAT family N-acetyltransferase [Catenuloplanes]|uniref:GNAT superfamily N-acetyltransferase n=1 Tax=Catenuloplanes niger TaxID=587534 RepID=A0AAE3ZXM0_9ACTN|nr:GNAT family N-acetyltransferase [Catenuloplanes niger]MDR7327934.1 GNAT superfamily N-acetyltransferase [Catenuloplanes niger]
MVEWSVRAASDADLDALVELRAVVMRPDLERLGRFDERRVRQRLRDGFVAAHTRVIEVGGVPAGCVALRPAPDGYWLEHFYLDPRVQGAGVGTAVLRALLDRADRDGLPVRLTVLRGSAARRLYERHGFVFEKDDPPIDEIMVRPPQ